MKKTFNIKFISMIILVFVCFLACNTKAEAVQCRYESLGHSFLVDDGFDDLAKNYQIEISNDSGSVQLSIYDKKNSKSIPASGTVSLSDFGGYSFRYVGSLSDIKLQKTCPGSLYYYSGNDASNSITFSYYTPDVTLNEFMTDQNCRTDNCGTLALSCSNCNKNQQGGNNDQSGTKCIYATYDDAKDNKAKDNNFAFNLSDLSIIQDSKKGEYQDDSISVGFTKKDLVNPDACPTNLYLNRVGTQYIVSLYASGDDSNRIGLLKTSVISHDSNKVININNICDKLDGSKTLGWVKKIYTLLRILVPTLIIILSVIDFLGVVLSGESEKMEKAKSKFIKRIIIGILFILMPFILEFILKMAGVIDSSLADVVSRIMN